MSSSITIPVLNGLLGEDSRFNGMINFEGSIRIDGIFSGKLICANNEPSAVIITEKASVEADIIADLVIVSGNFYGCVYALDKIQISAPGRVEGKIFTSNLIIDQGAYFQGQCISTRDIEDSRRQELKKLALNNPENRLELEDLPERILNPVITPIEVKTESKKTSDEDFKSNIEEEKTQEIEILEPEAEKNQEVIKQSVIELGSEKKNEDFSEKTTTPSINKEEKGIFSMIKKKEFPSIKSSNNQFKAWKANTDEDNK